MASDETYISDLPQIIEITPSDSFIVETTEGTKRILWQNVIIGEDNIDFYNLITQNQTDILTLSSDVTALSATTTTLVTDVSALSASSEQRQKYGWAYVEIDGTGSIALTAASDNVNSITLTDAGSRVWVQTSNSIDFANSASINVTFNNSITSTAIDPNDYTSYTPVIDGREDGKFKVGRFVVDHRLETLALITGVTTTTTDVNYATDINTSFVNVSADDGTISSPQVVKNVALVATNTSVINGVTTTTTSRDIQTVYNKGDSLPITADEETGDNFGINIIFRYK